MNSNHNYLRALSLAVIASRTTVTCPTCNGEGSHAQQHDPTRDVTCPDCKGDGEVTRAQAQEIRERVYYTEEDVRSHLADLEYHFRVEEEV